MDSVLSPHCRIYVPVERRGKYGSPYTWLACNIGRTKFAADEHQQAVYGLPEYTTRDELLAQGFGLFR